MPGSAISGTVRPYKRIQCPSSSSGLILAALPAARRQWGQGSRGLHSTCQFKFHVDDTEPNSPLTISALMLQNNTCQSLSATGRHASTAPPRLKSTAPGGCAMSARSHSASQTPATASGRFTSLPPKQSSSPQAPPNLPKPVSHPHCYSSKYIFFYNFI